MIYLCKQNKLIFDDYNKGKIYYENTPSKKSRFIRTPSLPKSNDSFKDLCTKNRV